MPRNISIANRSGAILFIGGQLAVPLSDRQYLRKGADGQDVRQEKTKPGYYGSGSR